MTGSRPAFPHRRPAGFTLIEVMVAIALMAVVAIISWRGLESVSGLRRRLDGDAQDVDAIVRMLGQIERDVALRAPDNLIDLGEADTSSGGGTSSSSSTGTANASAANGTASTSSSAGNSGTSTSAAAPSGGTLPPSQSLPQSIRVVAAEAPGAPTRIEIIRSDAAIAGAWQRVVWYVQDGTLRRAASLPARQYPIPPAGPGAVILDSVQRLVLRGWVPGRGWITTPFPPTGIALSGLELSVDRLLPSGAVERYQRVVVFN